MTAPKKPRTKAATKNTVPSAADFVGERGKPAPAQMTSTQKLDAKGIDSVCDDILNGETLTSIARKCQLPKSTLLLWIANDNVRSARVREARKLAAYGYEEEALEAIRKAQDPFELARAKEEGHHLRWRASKMNPIFADKVAVGGAEDLPPVRHALEMSDEALLAIAMQAKPQ